MMYSLETMGFHVEYPMELELSWNRTFSSFHTYLPTWNYHKKGFVLHENSMEYFTWNLTESLWKNSYVLPT